MNIRPGAGMMIPGRRAVPGWAAIALAVLPGCGEELGPEPMPTAPVAGRVTLAGEPVPRGWVEFLPVDGTVGRLRSARIGPDGSFRADGVAVGRLGLRVVGAPLPPEEARLIGQAYLIRRDVPPEGAPDLAIDLRDERLRIQAGLTR